MSYIAVNKVDELGENAFQTEFLFLLDWKSALASCREFMEDISWSNPASPSTPRGKQKLFERRGFKLKLRHHLDGKTLGN